MIVVDSGSTIPAVSSINTGILASGQIFAKSRRDASSVTTWRSNGRPSSNSAISGFQQYAANGCSWRTSRFVVMPLSRSHLRVLDIRERTKGFAFPAKAHPPATRTLRPMWTLPLRATMHL